MKKENIPEAEKEYECGKYLYYIAELGESIQIFCYTDPNK